MNIKYFLLSIFLFTVVKTDAQTCVIAKIDSLSKKIFIGADTKFSMTTFDREKNNFDTNIVYDGKIFRVGKMVFATIGGGSNYQKICGIAACENSTDINVALHSFKIDFITKMGAYLDSLQRLSPALFRRFIQNHSEILSKTIFCGFQNDTPFIKLVTTKVFDSLDKVFISYYEYSLNSICAGETESINDKFYDNSSWKKGYKNGIKILLKIEAKARPLEVGEPFEYCEITDKRIKFDRHNPYSH